MSPETVLTSNFVSLEKAVNVLGFNDTQEADQEMAEADAPVQAPAAGTPPHSDETSCKQGRLQDKILDWVMKNIFHSRREIRCAACVWLVCLLAYTDRHPKIVSKLPDMQHALLTLVGDSSEVTQEMASRGLSIVYTLGDRDTRRHLVSGLVQVLQGGSTGVREVKLEGDTKLFEEGQLGKAPGRDVAHHTGVKLLELSPARLTSPSGLFLPSCEGKKARLSQKVAQRRLSQ